MTSLEAVEAILSGRAAELGVRIERGVVVDAVAQDDEGVEARVLLDFRGELDRAAQGWKGRIRHAAGRARDDLGLDAVLVRPDGVVAWAGEPGQFEEVAGRWFGAPLPAPSPTLTAFTSGR
jgi:flavin-dependent dehydrogenase